MSTSRAEQLKKILENLQAGSNDIEACAIVSEDGLMITSLLSQDFEETEIAAMGAAVMAAGIRTAQELNRGPLQQLFIKGENGYVIGMNAGPHAVLIVLARKEAKLGLLFLDLSRATTEIDKALT
jgi:predicted regulator of Ras-like GTPase activity (Roadblock/LC7/MglB family)